MSAKIRTSGFLAGLVTLTALAVPLTAAPAEARSWVDRPETTCTDLRTVRQVAVNGRTVELRAGVCGDGTYGWGRLRGFKRGDYLRFEVDLNGDRRPDLAKVRRARFHNHTPGYRTHWSEDRAFRACVVIRPTSKCNHSNSTDWW